MQPRAHHLAEFNIGTLRYDWEDPRVADFLNNLDRIYALAARSPGYVWHMAGEAMERAQRDAKGILGGDLRTASTLSVWESPAALEHFAFNTLHKRFYDRKDEWFDATDQSWHGHRLVMWYVPEGHRPSLHEAVLRLNHLVEHGSTDHAFGWSHLKGLEFWQERQCGDAA